MPAPVSVPADAGAPFLYKRTFCGWQVQDWKVRGASLFLLCARSFAFSQRLLPLHQLRHDFRFGQIRRKAVGLARRDRFRGVRGAGRQV